jgi:hypothetical protein
MLTHNAAGTNQQKTKEVRPKMLTEPAFDETARTTCREVQHFPKNIPMYINLPSQ